MTAGQDSGVAAHPCLYCPPSDSGESSCDGHGGCAFPHEPQVDGRAAGVIFTALPVSFVAPSAGTRLLASGTDPAVPDIIPRVRLSVSYCRFIE